MDNVFLPNEVLSELHKCESPLKIRWRVKNYSHVKKEDVLCEIIYTIQEIKEGLFSNRKKSTNKKRQIVSPSTGYIYITGLYSFIDFKWYKFIWDDDTSTYDEDLEYNVDKEDEDNDIDFLKDHILASIFDSPKELFTSYYNLSDSELENDPYTKTKRIKWCNQKWINISFGVIVSIDFTEDKALFCFETKDKVQKGDCLSFLFDNGKTIDYLITTNPIKNEMWAGECDPISGADFNPEPSLDIPGYEVSFILYQEDADLLLNSKLISLRISYNNVRKHPDTYDLNDTIDCWMGHPYTNEAIHSYVESHLDAIKKLVPNYQFPRRIVEKTKTEYDFPGCYVYLMKDISNGYHKIGISNTPEYRERTLQSEKPTIEMLACKKFPTRKIAESIESALHTAYSQQRLRGEWFNLNEADVAAIIETLK